MHRLDRPSAFDKSRRQVIEQFRIRRTIAHLAEVAGRAHDARAEVMLPDPIHHHARGQRILRDGDRFGQFQPAAALGETALGASRTQESKGTRGVPLRRDVSALPRICTWMFFGFSTSSTMCRNGYFVGSSFFFALKLRPSAPANTPSTGRAGNDPHRRRQTGELGHPSVGEPGSGIAEQPGPEHVLVARIRQQNDFGERGIAFGAAQRGEILFFDPANFGVQGEHFGLERFADFAGIVRLRPAISASLQIVALVILAAR